MTSLNDRLQRATVPDRECHRPEFLRLSEPGDRVRMEALLDREPHVMVSDDLRSQLGELVRTLNPSRIFSAEERDAAVDRHLGDTPAEEYGVWVYYPWSRRLVHLLDEAEFAMVRTDRNRNKITAQEQAELANKRIGVIGLSVGQSICLTLALERGFGELRIADFDTLELSNLNRIRSATYEMGHAKAVNVAREIAELDPFLKVTVYTEGLSRSNVDRFLTEGGALDVLVDECDSVDVKIMGRLRAKEHGIPVVMDTSDRGLIDVERFDLEPDRPIMHGYLEELDLSVIERPMTNAEKLPFLLAMVGTDTLSDRMKASLPEVGKTLVTWPQLASGVTLGGAIVADLIRRMCLGQMSSSGRWWVDLNDLLTEATSAVPPFRKTISPAEQDRLRYV